MEDPKYKGIELRPVYTEPEPARFLWYVSRVDGTKYDADGNPIEAETPQAP